MRKILIVLSLVLVLTCESCTTRDEKAGVIILTYTRWGQPSEMDSAKELIAEFERQNPNIKVQVDIVSWEQYWQKIKTSAVTGTAQDVWLMSPAFVEMYIESGQLLDLMPFIRKDPTFDVNDYFPHAFDSFVYVETDNGLKPAQFGQGSLYALTRDYNMSVLYYNRDHFDAQGLSYPDETWTWDDLVAAAKKLTIDFDKDGIIDQWGYSGLEPDKLGRINGAIPIDLQNRRSNYSSPEMLEAVRFCQDLIHKYKVHPPASLRLQQTETFAAGRVSMAISGIWNVRENNNSEFLWDIAPIPVDHPGRVRAPQGGGMGHCIWSGTKHPEAAWKLVKYLSGRHSQHALARSGTSVPVLIEAAKSDDFLAPFDRPSKESYHYVFDSFKGAGQRGGYLKGYQEYNKAIRDQLDLVWRDPNYTPEKACHTIDQKVDKIIEDAYKKAEEEKKRRKDEGG